MIWRTACDAVVPVFRQRFTCFQQSVNRAKPHVGRGRGKRVESRAKVRRCFAAVSPLREGPWVRNLCKLSVVKVSNAVRLLKPTIQQDCQGNRGPRALDDESVETLCGIAAMRNRSVKRWRVTPIDSKHVRP